LRAAEFERPPLAGGAALGESRAARGATRRRAPLSVECVYIIKASTSFSYLCHTQ
jgi:hypothetical protein